MRYVISLFHGSHNSYETHLLVGCTRDVTSVKHGWSKATRLALGTRISLGWAFGPRLHTEPGTHVSSCSHLPTGTHSNVGSHLVHGTHLCSGCTRRTVLTSSSAGWPTALGYTADQVLTSSPAARSMYGTHTRPGCTEVMVLACWSATQLIRYWRHLPARTICSLLT
jgi:hypothetical protein